jgi:flagellin
MAQTINTNVASLNAQRNLNHSQADLNTSLQRLSSGLRINSAKDDSAGLAISERMTAQIRGLNQASRNANDAISLSQTAEGNLAEIGNVLQRMREIAVQSVSDTNTSADRASLQAEVASLTTEVDRIATSAQFNGKNLLDGTFGTATFQVGANANQSISLAISSAKAATLGLGGAATAVGGATGTSALVNNALMTMGGATIAAAINDGVSYVAGAQAGTTSALASANTINLSTATSDITATAKTQVTSSTAISTLVALADGDFKVNGTSIGVVTLAVTAADRTSQMVLAINAISGTTGVTAAQTTGSAYQLTAADGRNIDITSASATTAATSGAYTGFAVSSAVALTHYGQVTLSSGKAFTVGGTVAGGVVAGTYALIGSTVDVSTTTGSTAAIQSLDAAITKVNSQRATLGTMQSRFDSVISNLNTSSENLSAARGRIRDADFAKETASLTRNQILQQAGVAMLAQANSLPSNVLALLK